MVIVGAIPTPSRIYLLRDSMKKLWIPLVIATAYWLISTNIKSNPMSYALDRVVDGDTIVATYSGEQQKIRILWCDAPESTTLRYWVVQSWGKEATAHLKRLLSWEDIKVVCEAKGCRKDKYWRLLAYVKIWSADVCEAMVNDWYAKKVLPY